MLPMRDKRQTTTTEDRATQPMEAGGWVSQYSNEFEDLFSFYTLTHSWTNVRTCICTNKFDANECPNRYLWSIFEYSNIIVTHASAERLRLVRFQIFLWCLSKIPNSASLQKHVCTKVLVVSKGETSLAAQISASSFWRKGSESRIEWEEESLR